MVSIHAVAARFDFLTIISATATFSLEYLKYPKMTRSSIISPSILQIAPLRHCRQELERVR